METETNTAPAPRVLLLANRKGGSGKTTLAVNLAAAIGAAGKRVLLADLDPQCHATYISGIDPYDAAAATKLGLALRCGQPERGVRSPEHDLFDVLPCYHASTSLPIAPNVPEVGLSTFFEPGATSRMLCAPLFSAYDVVVIDTPPSGEDALRFAVSVGTEAIIPLPLHFLAMEGLAQLIGLLRRHAAALNPALTLCGVVPVMTDAREDHSSRVLLQLREIFPDSMLLKRVRMDMQLAEAAWQQKPARLLFPESKAVADIDDLANTVLSATHQMRLCGASQLVDASSAEVSDVEASDNESPQSQTDSQESESV